jgi:CHASE3 domain sensor protein
MKEDDDDIQDYVASSGWRKKQVNEVYEKIRNDTIEEVAKEIEKMTAFGQVTIDSFTVYIRSMKR